MKTANIVELKNEPKIKYIIIGVHERDEMIKNIIKDFGEPIEVYYDKIRDKICSRRLNYVLEKYQNYYTHICIMQDDIQLCDNFKTITTIMCETHSDVIYALQCNTIKLKERIKDTPYILNTRGMSGQCIIFPTKYITDFIGFQKRNGLYNTYRHDDILIRLFTQYYHINVFTTIPCLIKHLAPRNSLLGHYNSNGVSHVWMGKFAPICENWYNTDYNITSGKPAKLVSKHESKYIKCL